MNNIILKTLERHVQRIIEQQKNEWRIIEE